MDHKTDTGIRADFNTWLRTYEDEVGAIDEAAAWAGFSGARASLAASAGSEPVAAGSLDQLKLMMEHSAFAGELQLDDALANIDEFAVARPSPPEGAWWRRLPVEATEEMKAAAVKYANGSAVYKNVKAEVLRIEEGIYGEVYEAMIAAAPSLPAPPASEAKEA